MPITETGVHTMRIHAQAAQTFADIGTQANCVSEFWGSAEKNPEWALKTSTSAARQVTQQFNAFFGGESVFTRDGDLSIFVKTSSGFVYALIGHPLVQADRALDDDIVAGAAPVKGRFCFTRVGEQYCGQPIIKGAPTCIGHDGVAPMIFAAPLPISWSSHS